MLKLGPSRLSDSWTSLWSLSGRREPGLFCDGCTSHFQFGSATFNWVSLFFFCPVISSQSQEHIHGPFKVALLTWLIILREGFQTQSLDSAKIKYRLTRADKPRGSFRFRLLGCFCFEVKAKICKPVWLLIITNFMGQAERCSILKLNRWFYIPYLPLRTKTLRHVFLLYKFVWFSGVLEILESLNIRRKLKALKTGVKNMDTDH